MKETVYVNIASEAFILDTDAYSTLREYFDDIRSRLPQEDTETMADIEARMAELFREQVQSPMRVVTLETVRAAMLRMGSPADFGERHGEASGGKRSEGDKNPDDNARRLYRSRSDRSIAGICGGIGEFFGIDPTLLRIVTLLLILFGGLSIWVYILLWIIVPEAPAKKIDLNRK